MKLAALFTGGKDSTYAVYLAKKQGHEIACLITMYSENADSYMFHTPAIELTKLQAEVMKLPLIIGTTKGEKEKELLDLENTVRRAKEKFDFRGLITGALFSEYQASRIKKIAKQLGFKVFSPLWHKPQKELMKELLQNNFKFMFTKVAAEGLNKNWLNKEITMDYLRELNELNKKIGLNVAGEGGEFESWVFDCPLFEKKIVIEESEIIEVSQNCAYLTIKKAGLVKK